MQGPPGRTAAMNAVAEAPHPPVGPLATYRIQLGHGMGFADVAAHAPYLAGLGISHVYLSPAFAASPGSTHGYDVVDPARLNPELGGEAGFTELCRTLTQLGMGLVLDVVPNHMAAGAENQWWWDLLENGPASRYAGFFDVDWKPPEERLRDVILLPILGDHYGRVLESGELRLTRTDGEFTLRYGDQRLPVTARSLRPLLAEAAHRTESVDLSFIADAYPRLAPDSATDPDALKRRYRDKGVLGRQLARLLAGEPAIAGAVDEVVAETNLDPERLGTLLDAQYYRLAFWRTAGRELGYRRFFDIDTTVAVRVEDEEVFGETHRLIVRLVDAECVEGLRVDHIDGLRRPAEYLRNLRAAAPGAWIVVEKILEGDEALRPSWPAAGTTGYEFLNLAGGLLIDPAAAAPLDDLYREFTNDDVAWEEIAHQAKRIVMQDLLGSDVARTTQLLLDVCESRPRYRDYSRHDLDKAVRAVLAAFPVYRTYVDPIAGEVGDEDVRYVGAAVDAAKNRHPELDPELLDLIASLLLLRITGEREAEFVARFQQVSGPVMAKGVEDTAFYRYHRFIVLNEVGGDPSHFAVSVDSFHEGCAEAARRRPAGMLTLSTHDTKRSEDVRARLAVLSEVPGRWRDAVVLWHAHFDGVIDAPTAYLFFQTVVGAWPIDAGRMMRYMEKATKEAKLATSWVAPDEAYDTRLDDFVSRALRDKWFTSEVARFVASLEPAATINALAQKLLLLTAPGVPDVYQGSEVWHRRLVDPDNRCPVDFTALAAQLVTVRDMPIGDVSARAAEGLPKLRIVARALHARRAHPRLLGPGASYEPIPVHGPAADHVVAFLRGGGIATVVPRFNAKRRGGWDGTVVELPGGPWTNVLTDETVPGGAVGMGSLTASFPVALLLRAAS